MRPTSAICIRSFRNRPTAPHWNSPSCSPDFGTWNRGRNRAGPCPRLLVLFAAAGFALCPGRPAHRPRHIYRGVPDVSDNGGPTRAGLCVGSQACVTARARTRRLALPRRRVRLGKRKGRRHRGRTPGARGIQDRLYEGASIANELVRRGYVVITIDMFYWGERRMLLDGDPSPIGIRADDGGRLMRSIVDRARTSSWSRVR